MVTIHADAPTVSLISTVEVPPGRGEVTRRALSTRGTAVSVVTSIAYCDPYWADGHVYDIGSDVYEDGHWIDGYGVWQDSIIGAIKAYQHAVLALAGIHGVTL